MSLKLTLEEPQLIDLNKKKFFLKLTFAHFFGLKHTPGFPKRVVICNNTKQKS